MPSVSPVNAAFACGFQYGAAKPASAGTKVTPAVPSTVEPSRSRSAGSDMIPMSISQLDRGTDGVHLAVEAVRESVSDPPGRATDQAIGRSGRVVAGARQHERPCAVGALRLACGVAVLGEQRGLLVDACSGDGHGVAEQRAVAECFGVSDHGRQRRRIDAEDLAGALAPLSCVEIEEQRSAGCCDVGGKRTAHSMQHPRVGRGDRRTRRRPVLAATRSSERRSRDQVRGRCVRRGTRHDRGGGRTPLRHDDPARQSPDLSAHLSIDPMPSRSRLGWPDRLPADSASRRRPSLRCRQRSRWPTAPPDRARQPRPPLPAPRS